MEGAAFLGVRHWLVQRVRDRGLGDTVHDRSRKRTSKTSRSLLRGNRASRSRGSTRGDDKRAKNVDAVRYHDRRNRLRNNVAQIRRQASHYDSRARRRIREGSGEAKLHFAVAGDFVLHRTRRASTTIGDRASKRALHDIFGDTTVLSRRSTVTSEVREPLLIRSDL